mmetsp:Transcript_127455/g.231748  ORF Transcript_127455/g.231748 Transcript_127455/m.231748 type:complete len:249 (-) Transcript_127455:636-1382(-)
MLPSMGTNNRTLTFSSPCWTARNLVEKFPLTFQTILCWPSTSTHSSDTPNCLNKRSVVGRGFHIRGSCNGLWRMYCPKSVASRTRTSDRGRSKFQNKSLLGLLLTALFWIRHQNPPARVSMNSNSSVQLLYTWSDKAKPSVLPGLPFGQWTLWTNQLARSIHVVWPDNNGSHMCSPGGSVTPASPLRHFMGSSSAKDLYSCTSKAPCSSRILPAHPPCWCLGDVWPAGHNSRIAVILPSERRPTPMRR